MSIKEAGEYERLYSLDKLGVEDLEATSILESVKFEAIDQESKGDSLKDISLRQRKPLASNSSKR